MAGLQMYVCVPAGVADVRAAIAEAMAPFERDADGDHDMDRRIWDWAAVSGGNSGYGFRIAEGVADDDPRLLHDDPVGDDPRHSLPGWCAGGPLHLLDLAGPQREAERTAGEMWDAWQRLRAALPQARPLADFFAEREAGHPGYSTQGAFDAHRAQPLIQEMVNELRAAGRMPGWLWLCTGPVYVVEGSEEALVRGSGMHDATVVFGVSREEFVDRGRAHESWRGGVLTTDGWWCEPDEDPVHATCPDRDACPHLAEAVNHATDIGAYFASLPADAYVAYVRCHV